MVDLVERKTGNLDRGIGQDQLLELDLEFLKVPLALFDESVVAVGDFVNARFISKRKNRGS